jgi:hypothetical protein
MKVDIQKLVHWQERQWIEMTQYHENFLKFTTENKQLWTGFEESWETITWTVRENQDGFNRATVEIFDRL